jgi:hypothetical protein
MSAPGYAVIAIYPPGALHPSLLSKNNKVIVFDTPAMAREFLPILGEGRICYFSGDGESVTFAPVDPKGVNRASVLTHYDVYNLPPGTPVRSETKGREWKRHIHYGQAMFEDAGQKQKPKGRRR